EGGGRGGFGGGGRLLLAQAAAGEAEEDVVERGLVELDGADVAARGGERAEEAGQHPVPAVDDDGVAHRRAVRLDGGGVLDAVGPGGDPAEHVEDGVVGAGTRDGDDD